MPLILDTHYVYALAGVPAAFRKRERDFLASVGERLLVSAVSIWEIRLKWKARYASGTRKGPVSADKVIEALETQAIEYLALTQAHAATELTAPVMHHDPFDELLLAQAQAEGVALLTRDAKLLKHPLARSIS